MGQQFQSHVASNLEKRERITRFVLGWALYDFACSFLMVNGGIYFPVWLVSRAGATATEFNLTLVMSGITALIFGPWLGRVADNIRRPILFLRLASSAMFACPLSLFAIDSGYLPDSWTHPSAMVALFVVYVAFQFAGVFYNALIPARANLEEFQRISGIGTAASWLGAIVGIIITYPFVTGLINIGVIGEAGAFLPSAIGFGFLAVMAFALLPTDRSLTLHEAGEEAPSQSRSVYRALFHTKGLMWLVIAIMLLLDALLTIQNNLSIYIKETENVTSGTTAILFLLLLTFACFGGVTATWLSRRHTYLSLRIATVLWSSLLVTMALTHGLYVLGIELGIAGLLTGFTLATGRAAFLEYVPQRRAAEYFGVYSSVERTASLSGPLLWVTMLHLAPFDNGGAYKLALSGMALLTIGSCLAFGMATKVRTKKSG